MTKLEQLLKFIPAFTVLSYICGVVIVNSHLLQYGIVDTSIVNIKFVEAGILYLTIAPFIIVMPLLVGKNLGAVGSTLSALLSFYLYDLILAGSDRNFLWKASLFVIGMSLFSFYLIKTYIKNLEKSKTDFTESPFRILVFFLASLILFGSYFGRIRNNFGGGKSYKKILILKENNYNIIKTNSLLHSDTLTVIYENSDFIYFENNNSTMSIRKDLILGEIMVIE